MPTFLAEARCKALLKLTYYLPHEREAVQNRVVYHVKEQNDSATPLFLAAALTPGLGALLSHMEASHSDCMVTYVPRSRRRFLREGVDQARLLARSFGEVLGVPCRTLIARDPKSNTAQKTLTPAERQKNAQSAFYALHTEKVCRGKTLLLVDDVVTTGASMARCARLLYRMGAAQVVCVCIAVDHVNRDSAGGSGR